MIDAPRTERRQHQRYPMPTGVQFHHGPSQREFPGRLNDISAGGLLMFVPATTPIQPGHTVRLSLSALPHAEFVKMADQPLDATVVRVDRSDFAQTGHLAVGVRFA